MKGNRFSGLADEGEEEDKKRVTASELKGSPNKSRAKETVAFDCETNTEILVRTDDPAWGYAKAKKKSENKSFSTNYVFLYRFLLQ